MTNEKVRVAVTQGDTNGIGYELIFKTFADPDIFELCTPVVYGSPKAAAYHNKLLASQATFSIVSNAGEVKDNRLNILTTYDEETKIDIGQPTAESGLAALKALDRAMSDYRDNGYDVLVTTPISKSNTKADGFAFNGNAGYVETSLGEGNKTMPILCNENMKIASVAGDILMKDVPAAITKENIKEKAKMLHKSMRRDFRISNPRIAVLALNPGKEPGKEEKEVILPAVNELADEGVEAFGPYPADEFFGNGYFNSFDAILAMYYDQGAIPFKTLSQDTGILYHAGLPVIFTEPDMTPCYDAAGKNITDAGALRNAVYMAIDIFRNRTEFDEASANPLKKLYHEKKDDSEKVRFAIPKKHSGAPFPQKNNAPAQKISNDSTADTAQLNENKTDSSAEIKEV